MTAPDLAGFVVLKQLFGRLVGELVALHGAVGAPVFAQRFGVSYQRNILCAAGSKPHRD